MCGACARVWGWAFFFFIFYTKKKKKTGFKKVWKHDFRWLNWPKLYKVDYILMSVKDCCSWSLGVLWNDFLLSFFLSFSLSFFKLKEKYLHFPFLCKFLLDSFWEHVHFCMWASTISLLLYGQPGEFSFELPWCYSFFFPFFFFFLILFLFLVAFCLKICLAIKCSSQSPGCCCVFISERLQGNSRPLKVKLFCDVSISHPTGVSSHQITESCSCLLSSVSPMNLISFLCQDIN